MLRDDHWRRYKSFARTEVDYVLNLIDQLIVNHEFVGCMDTFSPTRGKPSDSFEYLFIVTVGEEVEDVLAGIVSVSLSFEVSGHQDKSGKVVLDSVKFMSDLALSSNDLVPVARRGEFVNTLNTQLRLLLIELFPGEYIDQAGAAGLDVTHTSEVRSDPAAASYGQVPMEHRRRR
jgi:hypothetical protein